LGTGSPALAWNVTGSSLLLEETARPGPLRFPLLGMERLNNNRMSSESVLGDSSALVAEARRLKNADRDLSLTESGSRPAQT